MDIPEKAKVIPECSRRGIIPQELARNIEARLGKKAEKESERDKNDGIPYTRRTECAKLKISQSDFSIQNWEESVKLSNKLNISKDILLILTEYKNGRKRESLPTVPSRRQFGTVLILKMFRYKRKKYLSTVFITDVSILIGNPK